MIRLLTILLSLTVSLLWAPEQVDALAPADLPPLPRTLAPLTLEPPRPAPLRPVSCTPLRPPVYRWFNGQRYQVLHGVWIDEQGEAWRPIKVTTTAYTWVEGIGDSWVPAPGVTSTGKDAKRTRGVATNHQLLPPGTKLRIPGYGDTRVDDRCGEAYKAWRRDREIRVDIRIPNVSPVGDWRTNREIQRIALQHGCREDRIILRHVGS